MAVKSKLLGREQGKGLHSHAWRWVPQVATLRSNGASITGPSPVVRVNAQKCAASGHNRAGRHPRSGLSDCHENMRAARHSQISRTTLSLANPP